MAIGVRAARLHHGTDRKSNRANCEHPQANPKEGVPEVRTRPVARCTRLVPERDRKPGGPRDTSEVADDDRGDRDLRKSRDHVSHRRAPTRARRKARCSEVRAEGRRDQRHQRADRRRNDDQPNDTEPCQRADYGGYRGGDPGRPGQAIQSRGGGAHVWAHSPSVAVTRAAQVALSGSLTPFSALA